MADFWRAYHDEGRMAVPETVAGMSPLTWVELEEIHPEWVPAEWPGINPWESPLLISDSPFVQDEDGNWSFKSEEPSSKWRFEAEIDYSELFPAIGKTDYFGNEGAGILTCGCGVPGCAGIWSQTCHVSRRMVHWTVRETGRWTDLFFDREAYERGMVGILHDMVTSGKKYAMPYLCECEYHDWGKFVSEARAAVERCPDLRDVWEKCERSRQRARDGRKPRAEN